MTGALAVRDGQGERLIAWEAGFVTGCVGTEDGGDTLAGELIRRQIVGSGEIGRPSRFFKRKGTLKRKLARRSIMQSGEFNSVARSVVLEKIYDCFLLEEGTFEFIEDYDTARFDDDEATAKIKINPNEVLMEAMRRVDEWGRIRRSIPSFREVYVAKREPNDEDRPLERELLKLTAAGVMDLQAVINSSPGARFKSTEAILTLVESGALRVATVNEYITLGKAAMDSGDDDGAAAFYARGLSYERGNTALNEMRIAVLERLGRKQEAADERKLFAGTLLEKRDLKAAAEQYRKAVILVPADPLPRERLLDLHVEGKDLEAAREAGDELVKLYLKLGLGELAKKIFPRLLLLEPNDRWIRQRIAEVHTELHENKTAVGVYKELAQDFLDEDDDGKKALELLKIAAALAPKDKKLAGLVKDLETGEHKAKRRRRRLFTVFVVLLTMTSLALAWGVHEALAIAHMRKTLKEATFDQGCDGILITINSLQPGDPKLQLYKGTVASRWSKELAIDFARLYVRETHVSAESFVLKTPPAAPLSSQEVFESLEAALGAGEDSLLAIIDAAETALAGGDRAAASATIEAARVRVNNARLVLQKAGPATRGTVEFKQQVEDLRALLPRFYLTLGLVEIEMPAARAEVEQASQAGN